MTRAVRIVWAVALGVSAGALMAPPAGADGLPVLNIDAGPSGVTTPGSSARYVTLPAGRDTLVARVSRYGGEVLQSRVLKGRLTVPAVALDGTPSGLSTGERTLVLIEPRRAFPRETTRLAVLDARRLTIRHVVHLDGDFSFDAVSPDGSTMYLVEYLSRRDPTRYAVRAYDLRRRSLGANAIVDASEPDEDMRGYPVTRATSRDGRWEYTLYDGAGEHPFIHALDTVRGVAHCIDLDALEGNREIFRLRLSQRGGGLAVVDRGRPLVRVDPATLKVVPLARPAPAPEPAADKTPWAALAAVPVALLLTGATTLALRRRRRR